MRFKFEDTVYRDVCGKAPRGCGGWMNWHFECRGERFQVHARTYTDAKVRVAREIRTKYAGVYHGTVTVYILP